MNAPRLALPPLLAALLSACAFHWEPAFQESAEPGQLDEVAIAEPDVALTFARVAGGPGGASAAGVDDAAPRVLAVRSYRAGRVAGVDLSHALGRPAADPIAVLRDEGYDRLRDVVRDAAPEMLRTVAASDLVMPVDLRSEGHIAAGTNFPEHAGESGVERGPFLFPKEVRPTPPDAPVSAGAGLLDYEVELAFVPLAPIAEGERPPQLGLVLANDYTDRETLLRSADPWDVESGKGFTTGKSFPGYLPVGNLFVVPRDVRTYAPALELRLYVNGALRQRSKASEMIWDLDALLAQIWARRALRWDHRGKEVSLLGDATAIPERTLILAGTPHGTVFAGISTRQMLLGAGAWALGGFRRPVPEHVIDAYVADARAAGIYLQPGDEVVIDVDGLGVIRNRIEP